MDLTIAIANQTLSNPIGVASGTFGFGEEYKAFMDYGCLGAVYTKAVTPERRDGNASPRLVETDSGLINSIGLANPGLDGFLREKAPGLSKLPCPAIVNVSGSTEADYLKVAEAMNQCASVWGIELNVSCPNVDSGGIMFGTDPSVLEKLTASVRKICSKPLIVKLSPNVTDITRTALAAEAGGADALSCINTMIGMKVDVHARKPVIPRGTGGLSGPAIRPMGVAAVWKVSQAVRIPVIGIGGIGSAEDALEYLLAGASAIQVGTAIFSDPDIPCRVLSGIKDYMKQSGFEKISDLHGHF